MWVSGSFRGHSFQGYHEAIRLSSVRSPAQDSPYSHIFKSNPRKGHAMAALSVARWRPQHLRVRHRHSSSWCSEPELGQLLGNDGIVVRSTGRSPRSHGSIQGLELGEANDS